MATASIRDTAANDIDALAWLWRRAKEGELGGNLVPERGFHRQGAKNAKLEYAPFAPAWSLMGCVPAVLIAALAACTGQGQHLKGRAKTEPSHSWRGLFL
jgi:hypothetical protein